MKKYETYLPVFPGFYGTIFEAQDESETNYINEQRREKGLDDVDDIDFDYAAYRNDMTKECCSVMEGLLKPLGVVSSITIQELVSPREYNFYNDSINVVIGMDVKNRLAIRKYIQEHVGEFRKWLRRRYTSYDGFISSYSNNAEDWAEETGNFYRFDNPGHYLGAVLEFICDEDGITDKTLYNLCENVSLSVVDYGYEVSKVKCPVCGTWYSVDVELKVMYDAEIERAKELYKKPFVPYTYEAWLKKQEPYKHCS